MKHVLAIAVLLIGASSGVAQHAGHGGEKASVYSGEETRSIKSLSDEDIADLLRGEGWGFARAAELNGVPGPMHLLELADAIGLDPDQVAAVKEIFNTMRTRAVAEGSRLVAREEALDLAFRTGVVTDASLRSMLAEIEESRIRLRYVHLSAHLTTPPLLSPEQLERYGALRGYGLPADALRMP